MEFPNTPSLVIPHGSHSSGKCGYCKQQNTDEQKTTWGTYCYKPLNKVTCCPSYTIQCDALNFQLKRSHKRVLKNMCDFLKYGKLSNVKIVDNLEPASTPERNDHCEGIPTDEGAGDLRVLSTQSVTGIQQDRRQSEQHCAVDQTDCSGDKVVSSSSSASSSRFDGGSSISNIDYTKNYPKSPLTTIPTATAAGDGVPVTCVNSHSNTNTTSNRPTKAHVRRWIAKQEHLRQRSLKENRSYETLLQEYYSRRQKRLEKNKPKQVEDFLQREPSKGEGKHFLEIRLIRTTFAFTDVNYESALKLSHKIYEQYQIHIHKDDINDCNWEQFKRFLIKSPLVLDNPEWNSTLTPMFGSYHQQYWLDGEKIIAVGVIDILPKCLSSVYVFYDPQYAFLHLGTYTALREIAFVRQLARTSTSTNDPMYSNFKSYYMGFYIHSCRKMSYKAQYTPAYLACPETYNWLPIAECLKALNASPNKKYARFSDLSAVDLNAIPKCIDMDTLDSQIYFCIIYMNDNENDSGGGDDNANYNDNKSLRSPPISLKALRSRLNRRSIPIFREWAKLLGNRVLSGHFQIIIHSQ